MSKTGKGMFGKGFNFKTEVTNGQCPVCEYYHDKADRGHEGPIFKLIASLQRKDLFNPLKAQVKRD